MSTPWSSQPSVRCVENRSSPHLKGLDSTDPRIRNDATYRRNRMSRYTGMIESALEHGKTFMLNVARLDTDMLELSARYNIPIYRGPNGPSDEDKSPIKMWCILWYEGARFCDNPVCSIAEIKGEPLKRCGRCRTVSYCSITCQRAHWKAAHKAQCKEKTKDTGDF